MENKMIDAALERLGDYCINKSTPNRNPYYELLSPHSTDWVVKAMKAIGHEGSYFPTAGAIVKRINQLKREEICGHDDPWDIVYQVVLSMPLGKEQVTGHPVFVKVIKTTIKFMGGWRIVRRGNLYKTKKKFETIFEKELIKELNNV